MKSCTGWSKALFSLGVISLLVGGTSCSTLPISKKMPEYGVAIVSVVMNGTLIPKDSYVNVSLLNIDTNKIYNPAYTLVPGTSVITKLALPAFVWVAHRPFERVI